MNWLLSLAVITGAIFGAAPALAQSSASQTTNGSATIIRAITLGKTSDILFGRIVRPSSGTSTITIDATTGARSITGGGDAVAVSGATSRATYNVGGEGGQTYTITVPASFTMTRSGGSETLTVNLTGTATSGTLSGSLGADGANTLGVGGSFDVSNSTATGAYTGTFIVTVAYN